MTTLIDTQHVFAGEYTQSNRPEMPSGTMVLWCFPVKILPKLPRFPPKKTIIIPGYTWFPQKTMVFPGHNSIFCHPWRRVFHRLVFELCAIALGTDWPVRLNDDGDLAGSGILGKWSAKLGSLWNDFLKNWKNCGISVRQLWDDCGITMWYAYTSFFFCFHVVKLNS